MTSVDLIENKGRLFRHFEHYEFIPNTLVCNIMGEFNLIVYGADTSLTPGLINDGYWESNITSWLWNTLEPGSVFLDVGANCGYYTILAEKLGASVIAFEPNPPYIEVLQHSKDLNDCEFEIIPVALSDFNGQVELNIPGTRHGDSSIVNKFEDRGNSVPITVDVMRLDDIYDSAQDERPFIIKIDTEGAEENVICGAENLLGSSRSGIIMLEWTPGMYSDSFFDRLQAFGEVRALDGRGMEVEITAEELDSRSDWTMVIVRNAWK